MHSELKKNTLYNLIRAGAQIIFPLITFPYISRVLSTENIGKINFGNSIISYVSLIASLGVSTYAIRECSRVKNEKDKLNNISSQIFSINIISTVLAYLVLAIVLIAARPLDNYRVLICIQSANVIFGTLGADWINSSMEDFKYITIRTLTFQIIAIASMFIFVHKPSDYMIYAIISVLSTSGANICNIFYRKKYCKISFTLKMNIRKHLKPIILVFAMILSQTIFCNSDITMLGLMKGDHEVGLYSTSVKIYNIVNTMIASIAWVVMPQMSYNFGKNNYSEVNRILRYSLNFIVSIGLPCIIGINMLCPEILEIVAGKKYLGATDSLHILTIALTVSLIAGIVVNIILLPSMKEDVCLKACAWAAVVNIISNYIFIPKYGLNAAAATTVLAQLITLIISIRAVDKNICITEKKGILLSPCIGCVGLGITLFVIIKIANGLWTKAILSLVVGSVVYLSLLFIFKNELIIHIFESIKNSLRQER